MDECMQLLVLIGNSAVLDVVRIGSFAPPRYRRFAFINVIVLAAVRSERCTYISSTLNLQCQIAEYSRIQTDLES
jgi:hypothetical protein